MQGRRRIPDHAGGYSQPKRQTAVFNLPALYDGARGVKAIDCPTMFTSRHADHDTPVLQPRPQRRGQPPRQLPIAPGPGQHARVAPGRWLGGERPNAVAAGNVIDASPGRHAGQAGAAIIAAAAVQIPAQRDATLLLPVRLCSEINSTW